MGGLPSPAAADCFLPFKWGGGLGFCPVLGLSFVGEICSNELCGFIWGRKLPPLVFSAGGEGTPPIYKEKNFSLQPGWW